MGSVRVGQLPQDCGQGGGMIERQIDFTQSTPEERAQLLGPAFRDVYVYGFGACGPLLMTIVQVDEAPLALVGDPEAALGMLLDLRLESFEGGVQ